MTSPARKFRNGAGFISSLVCDTWVHVIVLPPSTLALDCERWRKVFRWRKARASLE